MNKKIIMSLLATATLAGCAGVPVGEEPQPEAPFVITEAALKDKSFVVTHINEEYLPDDLSATMNFGADNRLSGRGFCNMYMSEYEITYQDALEVNQLLNTKRLCSDERMKLEEEFNHILTHEMRFEESELGYKVNTESGSFRIMEIENVVHEKSK